MIGNAEMIFYQGNIRNDEKRVKEIQEALKTFNYYNGNIDGIYGPATEQAVKEFQASPECVNGTVDKCTWDKLMGMKTRLTSTKSHTKQYEPELDEQHVASSPKEQLKAHYELFEKGLLHFSNISNFPTTIEKDREFQSLTQNLSMAILQWNHLILAQKKCKKEDCEFIKKIYDEAYKFVFEDKVANPYTSRIFRRFHSVLSGLSNLYGNALLWER